MKTVKCSTYCSVLKSSSVYIDSDVSKRLSYHNHLVLSSASLHTVGICIHIYFLRSTLHILSLYQMDFPTGVFKAWLMPFPYDSNQLAMKLVRLSIFLFLFFSHSNYLLVNICEPTGLLPTSPGAYLKTSIFCYSLFLLLSWNGFLIIAYLRSDLNLVLFGNFYVTYLYSSLIQCN